MKIKIMVFIAVNLLASLAWAATPSLISFQGRLTDVAGHPVPEGDYSVTFAIYPVPTGDDRIWVETKLITVTDGLFTTNLGSSVALTNIVFTGPTRYLGIQVEVDKRAEERGFYAHPEASGKLPELGVDRVLHPRPMAIDAGIGDRRQ